MQKIVLTVVAVVGIALGSIASAAYAVPPAAQNSQHGGASDGGAAN